MRKISLVNIGNLLLGISLPFLFCTNFEFNSTLINCLFPLFVAFIALLSFKKFNKKDKRKIFFYLPSFVYGFGFYVICLIYILINLLGAFFFASEEIDKMKIQKVYSPNGIEYCEVYHYPVGAYSGGSGRVRVYLVNKYFPLIRKEVFYERVAHIFLEDDETSFEYISWENPDTITSFETNINVRNVNCYKLILILSIISIFIAYLIIILIFKIRNFIRKKK